MVYIFKTESVPSFLKIGYSKHSPVGRLKNLQTGCPFTIKLLYVKKGTELIEKILHGHMKEFRARGEWFFSSDESMERLESVFKSFGIVDAEIEKGPRVKKLGKLIDHSLHEKIMNLKDKGLTVDKIAKALTIHRCTVMRHTNNYRLRL